MKVPDIDGIDHIDYTSDWVACPDCDKLLRAGDKEAILAKIMLLYKDIVDMNVVIEMQEKFWAGNPHPLIGGQR